MDAFTPLCVVLAGGLGTRMHPETATVPKALLPVAGRPFLAWQLEALARGGVGRVLLCLGHLGEQVREFLAGRALPLAVDCVDDGDMLLGTGGALRRAYDLGRLDPAFLVTYGDSYLPVDFAAALRALVDRGAPALMCVLRNEDRWGRSNAELVDGRVRYDKSGRRAPPGGQRYIDYGLLALRREVVAESFAPGARADLADALHALGERGALAGLEVHRRFYEVGSPAGRDELADHLRGVGEA